MKSGLGKPGPDFAKRLLRLVFCRLTAKTSVQHSKFARAFWGVDNHAFANNVAPNQIE
jgi:hypothetical protein